MIKEINQGDTFYMYGELYCLMEIVQLETTLTDEDGENPFLKRWTEWRCENVLDETDKFKGYSESEMLHIFNNPYLYSNERYAQ